MRLKDITFYDTLHFCFRSAFSISKPAYIHGSEQSQTYTPSFLTTLAKEWHSVVYCFLAQSLPACLYLFGMSTLHASFIFWYTGARTG